MSSIQKDSGPLSSYNSLTDKNLVMYFSSTRMRKHLRKAGLINRHGEIVSETTYRITMARKEHKKRVKEMLSHAIVNKSLDFERQREREIKRYLEEIAKLELVKKIKADRHRGFENQLPFLASHISQQLPKSSLPFSDYSAHTPVFHCSPSKLAENNCQSSNSDTGVESSQGTLKSRSAAQRERRKVDGGMATEKQNENLIIIDADEIKKQGLVLMKLKDAQMLSPYLFNPMEPSYLCLPKSTSASHTSVVNRKMCHRQVARVQKKKIQAMSSSTVRTMCEVTMKYTGKGMKFLNDQFHQTQEILIDQQHCGGNTLTVCKERLRAGDEFSFISHRHYGYPFALCIYVDGMVDVQVSVCCEYRHRTGSRLGSAVGHFIMVKVTGGGPCIRCQVQRKISVKQNDSESTVQTEVISEKSKGVNEKFSEETDKTDEEISEVETDLVVIPVEDSEIEDVGKDDDESKEVQEVVVDSKDDMLPNDYYDDDFESEEGDNENNEELVEGNIQSDSKGKEEFNGEFKKLERSDKDIDQKKTNRVDDDKKSDKEKSKLDKVIVDEEKGEKAGDDKDSITDKNKAKGSDKDPLDDLYSTGLDDETVSSKTGNTGIDEATSTSDIGGISVQSNRSSEKSFAKTLK